MTNELITDGIRFEAKATPEERQGRRFSVTVYGERAWFAGTKEGCQKLMDYCEHGWARRNSEYVTIFDHEKEAFLRESVDVMYTSAWPAAAPGNS
jgi:hypothetical protein